MEEVVENQRWYTLSGWSDKLLEKDPPAWSDSSLTIPKEKTKFIDYTWQVYKGKDEYDENGWIYSTSFDKGEFGKKSATTVVRSRVWIGYKMERDINGNQVISVDTLMQTTRRPTPLRSPVVTTIPNSGECTLPSITIGSETPSVSVASPKSEDDNVKLPNIINAPMTPPILSSPSEQANVVSPPRSSGYLSIFSSAICAVQEVSAYAYDTAHMATVSAFDSTPVVVPPQIKAALTYPSAIPSRRFPDLSPYEKQMVSCCAAPSYHDEMPVPIESPTCKLCQTPFGMVKYRYFCGYCAESFCRDHLTTTTRVYAYGGAKLSKVCPTCVEFLGQKIDHQQRQWRIERVKDFFAGVLTPYVSISSDTALDKACRAAEGTLVAAKNVPLGATARMAVVSADFIRKYGRAGLLGFVLRNEFMQSFNTLRELLGDMESLTVRDASIGMYYFMATNRGFRGANPTLEEEQHSCCPMVSDDLLARMIKFAPITLHCVYELDILDMQRFAKLQGYTLIYASVENRTANQPAYGLVVKPEEKLGILMIRGSKSAQDVLTDLQIASATNSSTGPLDSFAHHGMAQAATWVKHQVVDSLRELYQHGYKFMINGHSLGGGVAALLSVMLHDEFPDLECFAYAVPACANREIAERCVPYVHSIVLRDDFVPRAKTHNIVRLSTELKDFRDNYEQTIQEDLNAVKSRVVSLWAPRKREWAQQEAAKMRGKLKPLPERKITGEKQTPTEDEAWTLNRTNLMDKYNETSPPTSKIRASDVSTSATPPTTITSTVVTHEEGDIDLETNNKIELFVPGQITHIYFVRGTYQAVHVDRDCEALTRIQVHENMLSDHLGRNYLEALRIVRDSRQAISKPPTWVPFETHTRCQCCESPFTWNSTSSSDAQANVDQHNCRNCGWLICDGCSKKRAPLPKYGINTPVRVCDRCFYQL